MLKNIFIIILPVFIYFALSYFIIDQKDLILSTLIILTIIFWATSIIPSYQTSIIFLFVALAFSLSSKEIIFSGFSSSAFWLVFAGMLMGTAIKNVNLNNRISVLFNKIKNPNYIKILLTVTAFCILFSFIMPSAVSRIVLLIPIAIAIAKNFGFEEGSKGYNGIILTFILTTAMSGFSILPSNAPNMILSGLTTHLFNYEILYSHYLIANFLIFGIIKCLIIVALIHFYFNDTPKIFISNLKKEKMKRDEKIVIITISLMLLFWFTDFIHGIIPSIVAIFGVMFLAFPNIAVIKTKDINTLNFASLLFLVGVISLGNISANDEFIVKTLMSCINFFNFTNSSFENYMKLSTLMSLTGVFLTQPTIPALFTPISEQISNLTGFNLFEVFMIQVAGFSTVFFPYQMPPVIIGLALANIKQRVAIKILIILAVLSVFILLPLHYLWLKII